MKRQYPFYVLYLTIPAEIVDVNVHPSKTDVRFVDNSVIFGCVRNVISAVLDGNSSALEYVAKAPTATPKTKALPAQTPQSTKHPPQVQPVQGMVTDPLFDITAIARENTVIPPAAAERIQPADLPFAEAARFTYEEAVEEIEKAAPAFTAAKKGTPLPPSPILSDEPELPDEPLKGFTPFEEIEEDVQDGKKTEDEGDGPDKSLKNAFCRKIWIIIIGKPE